MADAPDANLIPAEPEIQSKKEDGNQNDLRQLIQEELAGFSKQEIPDQPLQNIIASIRMLENRMERVEQASNTPSDKNGKQSRGDELRQMNDYAVQLFYMDQLDEALQMFKEAGKKFPGCVEVWNNLAVVYCALGRSDDAAQAFSHAIDLDPKSVEVLNNQGVLALLDTHPEKALEMLEEAQRRAPQEIDILFNLAQAHMLRGKHADAIKTWKIITSIDPHHEEANQQLRRFYQ